MYIARQPIFDRNLDVYAYELLFRVEEGAKSYYGISSEIATASVLVGLFENEVERIVDDKYAFVNFDANLIKSNTIELIKPDKLVIELLEDVEIDLELVHRLLKLKQKGYKIALDDFVEDYGEYPLRKMSHIIKFDILESSLDEIYPTVKNALADGKTLLAEKVETMEVFKKAREMGFHLFQGYFFSKPNIVGKTMENNISQSQYLLLLGETKKREPSYSRLEEIISMDPEITYRLLKIASMKSRGKPIDSIRNALNYMGLREMEKWISLLMIQDISRGKPLELLELSLIRNKFSGEIAKRCLLKDYRHEASLMGLFSTIDAMLDKDIHDIIEDLNISENVKVALTKSQGPLAPIKKLYESYELGKWSDTDRIAEELGLKNYQIIEQYLEALEWSKVIVKDMF